MTFPLTITDVFEQFAKLLEERFSRQVYTTEDAVRYTLFYCLTTYTDIRPADIILEYPHPGIPGAEIDAYVPASNERAGLAFECKFDREIPSRKNPPKTQKAGKVFSDIFRLARFKLPNQSIRRYFVYVTDKEMATYFQNPNNELNDFFNLGPGDICAINKAFMEKHSGTFINSAGTTVDCEVIGRLKERLVMSEIWIRIYEVRPK